MDLVRFALYTALAVITYLMLLAWQEDYPPTVASGGNEQIASLPAADQPSLPMAQSATSGDVANATGQDQAAGAADLPPPVSAQGAAAITTVSGGQIEVRTDTLSLNIDLLGGDINYLALPQYLRELDAEDDPFVMLSTAPGANYVAQSGLIGRDGIDSSNRARYRSASDSYVMAEDSDTLVVDLEAETASGLRVIKRFSFERGSYLIEISYLIENMTAVPWQANAFAQIKRDAFDDPSDAGGFGNTYLGFVSTTEDDPYLEIDFDDVEDGVPAHQMTGGWIGFSQHYFISVLVPPADGTSRFSTRRNELDQYFGGFTSTPISVAPGESDSYSLQFYAGPKDQYVLADIAPNLDLTIDYSFLWFLAAPIYWLLRQIDTFVGNYGVSIILLTILVKALFYKLTESQYKSMAGMRRLMPKLQSLKESYGDDRMKLQQATMELYKREKINPFGGCLPMLVQMPVFIALYWVLLESVELRHAPFLLWLQDLSVRDPFFVLPLLMGGTMYLQTLISPAPADPMQAKVMKIMPIMMTVLFLWFPAGLVLYWLTNAVLGIAQQWYITRKIEAEYAAKGS